MIYTDPDGEWFWLIGMAIGAIAAGWGKDLNKASTWRDIAFGAAVGAVAGLGMETACSQMGVVGNIGVQAEYGGQSIGMTLFSTNHWG